jgi:hypothetical protein
MLHANCQGIFCLPHSGEIRPFDDAFPNAPFKEAEISRIANDGTNDLPGCDEREGREDPNQEVDPEQIDVPQYFKNCPAFSAGQFFLKKKITPTLRISYS